MDDVMWTPAVRIGNQFIDDEHKHLFALVRRLVVSMQDGRGSTASRHIASELVAYTKIHFGHEEALMRAVSYPDFRAHEKQHREMARRAEDIERDLAQGAGRVGELLGFLTYWLREHIARDDADIARYLKQR